MGRSADRTWSLHLRMIESTLGIAESVTANRCPAKLGLLPANFANWHEFFRFNRMHKMEEDFAGWVIYLHDGI